jgi:hypothetical protein
MREAMDSDTSSGDTLNYSIVTVSLYDDNIQESESVLMTTDAEMNNDGEEESENSSMDQEEALNMQEGAYEGETTATKLYIETLKYEGFRYFREDLLESHQAERGEYESEDLRSRGWEEEADALDAELTVESFARRRTEIRNSDRLPRTTFMGMNKHTKHYVISDDINLFSYIVYGFSDKLQQMQYFRHHALRHASIFPYDDDTDTDRRLHPGF